MRVGFLVGSGISIDSGMPAVADISAQVFSGARVVRHSDTTYYIVDDPSSRAFDFYREQTAATVAFVNRVRDMAVAYFYDYAPDHEPNYEDVANVVRQIEDAISGEYENPALLPLLRELQAELGVDAQGLMELAGESHNYIVDVVWRMLSRPLASTDHLGAIVDGCRERGAVDIFDLNHDGVIATALARAGISCSDGFTRAGGDVYFWAGDFDAPSRHFKLHGAVNWFHRTLPDEPWRGWVVARSTTPDPYHEKDAGGELLDFPAQGRPVILVGTFDKPLSYDTTVFADQHFFFHESLRRLDRLVVIGYGFADRGINTRLIGWLLAARDRHLVVVHGDEQALVERARFAVKAKWSAWKDDGRLRVVPRWVADATWVEIRDACAS